MNTRIVACFSVLFLFLGFCAPVVQLAFAGCVPQQNGATIQSSDRDIFSDMTSRTIPVIITNINGRIIEAVYIEEMWKFNGVPLTPADIKRIEEANPDRITHFIFTLPDPELGRQDKSKRLQVNELIAGSVKEKKSWVQVYLEVIKRLFEKLGRWPTNHEIAVELKFTDKKVEKEMKEVNKEIRDDSKTTIIKRDEKFLRDQYATNPTARWYVRFDQAWRTNIISMTSAVGEGIMKRDYLSIVSLEVIITSVEAGGVNVDLDSSVSDEPIFSESQYTINGYYGNNGQIHFFHFAVGAISMKNDIGCVVVVGVERGRETTILSAAESIEYLKSHTGDRYVAMFYQLPQDKSRGNKLGHLVVLKHRP